MKVSEGLQRLKEQGHKYTTKREDILCYFADASGYRSAKSLLQVMDDKYPGISLDTIYRNLRLFEELALLESIERDGEKRYRIACTTEGHHHHFTCENCGTTEPLRICPLPEITNELADYQVNRHAFELFGICPACQS